MEIIDSVNQRDDDIFKCMHTRMRAAASGRAGTIESGCVECFFGVISPKSASRSTRSFRGGALSK